MVLVLAMARPNGLQNPAFVPTPSIDAAVPDPANVVIVLEDRYPTIPVLQEAAPAITADAHGDPDAVAPVVEMKVPINHGALAGDNEVE